MLFAKDSVPESRQGECVMILTSRVMQGPLCRRWCAAVAAVVIMAFAVPAQAVRIKDIATFSGVRDNQLIG